jgi:DNA anti-recombination protein RmuC
MFSALIESFFRNTSASSITELFLVIIVVVFIAASVLGALGRSKRFTDYAATLLTSIGILGTFAGIVIGLLAFDTANIDSSIPALLEGLKTAFITSVAGMLSAVLFSLLSAVIFSELAVRRQEKLSAEHIEQGVQPEHIYKAMQAQYKALINIYKGLSGSEEGSLVGQFKMLRADMTPLQTLGNTMQAMGTSMQQLEHLALIRDQLSPSVEFSFAQSLHQDSQRLTNEIVTLRTQQAEEQGKLELQLAGALELISQLRGELDQRHEQSLHQYQEFDGKLFTALDSFAEMMSRAATEQIIDALKSVIQEFNEKLTVQFGENFKALDESVKSLVVWQEQYRGQVEKMSDQYEQSVQSLIGTREAVAGIWSECENIPKAMHDLKDVLEVNQHQIGELQRHLEAFVSMRDKAIEAVPMIQGQVENLGQQLAASTETLHGHLLETSTKLTDGSNEIRVALEESAEHLQRSVTATQQAFSSMATDVVSSSGDMSQTLKDAATEINNQARDTLARMQDDSKKMQDEVAVTVSKLGEGTASVTRDLEKVVSSMERYSTDAVNDFKRLGESITSEINSTFSSAQKSMEGYMQQSVSKTGDTINTELKALETATAREISRAMQEMGTQLTTITGRFVQDYESMVRAMEKVIQTRLDN